MNSPLWFLPHLLQIVLVRPLFTLSWDLEPGALSRLSCLHLGIGALAADGAGDKDFW